MSWTLQVYNPGSTSPDNTYSDTAPGGIVSGFTWQLEPTGAPKQLRFQAVPALTALPPRALVTLDIDGTRQFYGVLVQTWSPSDRQVREYVAVGAALLVQQDVARHVDGLTSGDPADWFSGIAGQLANPWLSLGTVQADGSTLSIRNYEGLPAGKVFDDLARACLHTRRWWVDPTGAVTFADPTGNTLEVEADDPGLEWRAEDSTDTYDTVELYLLNKPVPDAARVTGQPDPDALTPALYTYSEPGYAYHATRVVSPPNQLDLLMRQADNVQVPLETEWTDLDKVVDGDDDTYATYNGSSDRDTYVTVYAYYDPAEAPAYWTRIRYYAPDIPLTVQLVHNVYWNNDADAAGVAVRVDLPASGNEIQTVWVANPWKPVPGGQASSARTLIWLEFHDVPAGTEVRLYNAEPYRYDPDKLERYAKALVQLPAQYPGALVRRQLQTGGLWTVTVRNLDGADRVLPVTGIENRYTVQDGAWSRVTFGSVEAGEAAQLIASRDRDTYDAAVQHIVSQGRRVE